MATTLDAKALASGDAAYLYRAAIGSRSQDYYLRHFARFDTDGKAGSSWHWAAYWSTLGWLIYRGMWGRALAYVGVLVGLALLIFGAGKLIFNYSDTSAVLLFLLLLSSAFVVPGMYANAWFYTHLNTRINAALRAHPDLKKAAAELASQAPDTKRLLLVGLSNTALLALMLLVVIGVREMDNDLPPMAMQEERVAATFASSQSTVAPPAPPVMPARTQPESPATPAAKPAPAGVAHAPESTSTTVTPVPVKVAEPAAAPASAPSALRVVQTSSQPVPNASGAAVVKTAAADRRAPVPASEGAVPARAEPVAQAAPATSTPPPAVVAPPAAAPAAPAPAAAPRPRQIHVWVIQVGAYEREANAQNALSQVQQLGLDAGTEAFDAPGKGRLTRVRVGPFSRQAEAEQAMQRIKALNLPVLLIRQRP